MRNPQVMIMSSVGPAAVETLEAEFELHRYDQASDKKLFLQTVGQKCQAVIINGSHNFGQDELQYFPNLEILSCTSAGYEGIDVAALALREIPVTNTSQALKDDVADTALMLVVAARRELVAGDKYVRSGEWGLKGSYPLLSSLKGKRAGILGLGTIGLEIATRLKAMRLEIGYCSRRKKDVAYSYFSDAQSLATWCDILIVAVPLGPDTEALIDQNVLKNLGPKGTLINIARGRVVDENALIECLKSGTLGSAGLDVFLNEPHPTRKLTELPNVTLYPHHASGTVETRSAMAKLAVDNLIAHFHKAPLLSQI